MKRLPLLLTLVACLSPGPAWAASADVVYTVTIDGRPLTPPGKPTAAFARGGVVFGDAVTLTKAYSGLLTIAQGGSSLRISIAGKNATFTAGSASADYDGKTRRLRAKPFMSNGDLYVPISDFALLAASTISTSSAAHTVALKSS